MNTFFKQQKTRASFLTALLALGLNGSVMAMQHSDRMGPVVREHAKAAGAEFIDVIVTYKQMPTQAENHRVEHLGGETKRAYGRLPMRAMSIPAHALEGLAHNKNIKFISNDGEVESYSNSAKMTANMPIGNNSVNTDFSGLGISVAVIDSGISVHNDHPANIHQYSFLGGAFNTPVISGGDIVNYRDQPLTDGYGHGSHIAGIIGGNGSESKGGGVSMVLPKALHYCLCKC